MEPGENEWLRAAQRERRDERRSLSHHKHLRRREREREVDVRGLFVWRLCDLAADWSGWYVL